MGIYVFYWQFLRELLRRDAEDPDSKPRFRRRHHPRAGRRAARPWPTASPTAASSPTPTKEAYWRDVGTIDALLAGQHRPDRLRPRPRPLGPRLADLDLCRNRAARQVHPRRGGPARLGRLQSLVSGGCIISGTEVRNSLLFTRCTRNSYSVLDHAVVLPQVVVERSAPAQPRGHRQRRAHPRGPGRGRGPRGGSQMVPRLRNRRDADHPGRCWTRGPPPYDPNPSVASECAPLVKTGGLADVVGALPGALAAQGCEMRVLLPGYPRSWRRCPRSGRCWTRATCSAGRPGAGRGRRRAVALLLEAPHLYDREGGHLPRPRRARLARQPASLRRAVAGWRRALAAEGGRGWRPDILHAHDWQAGFAPVYLSRPAAGRSGPDDPQHRLPGPRRRPRCARRCGCRPRASTPAATSTGASSSSLKAGLVHADRITTVSPDLCRRAADARVRHGPRRRDRATGPTAARAS